jgi:hypothetical protein
LKTKQKIGSKERKDIATKKERRQGKQGGDYLIGYQKTKRVQQQQQQKSSLRSLTIVPRKERKQNLKTK